MVDGGHPSNTTLHSFPLSKDYTVPAYRERRSSFEQRAMQLADLKMVLLPIFILAGPATAFSLGPDFLLQRCRCREIIFMHAPIFEKKKNVEELC